MKHAESGYGQRMCTMECATDAECAKLAPGFTCSGTTDGAPARKVCVPATPS